MILFYMANGNTFEMAPSKKEYLVTIKYTFCFYEFGYSDNSYKWNYIVFVFWFFPKNSHPISHFKMCCYKTEETQCRLKD